MLPSVISAAKKERGTTFNLLVMDLNLLQLAGPRDSSAFALFPSISCRYTRERWSSSANEEEAAAENTTPSGKSFIEGTKARVMDQVRCTKGNLFLRHGMSAKLRIELKDISELAARVGCGFVRAEPFLIAIP